MSFSNSLLFPSLLLSLLAACGADANGASGSTVEINGRALSEAQLVRFEDVYRVRPAPGRYWYDATSGLYGVEGQPAGGFMFPGHDYGPLDPRASTGDTDVFLNARELSQQEVRYVNALLGTVTLPGRYWLDAAGNVGYEGSPMPVVNLYFAARQRLSPGAGGDNFWTSRFSAGNATADGSQGYVSVPGYGPVSFGM